MSVTATLSPTLTATAQSLRSALESAHLNIIQADRQFERECQEDDVQDENIAPDLRNDSSKSIRDPAVVAADVAAHIVRPLLFFFWFQAS
jgi:hypothetical protein